MGLIEWRLRGTRDLPTLGVIQVVALFIGGLVISLALLAGAAQAGGGIYLLTQLIAVVLFVVRIWPRALRVDWVAAQPIRHVAIASIWVVVALALFMYLVFSVITAPDPERHERGPGQRPHRERPFRVHRHRHERHARDAGDARPARFGPHVAGSAR